MKDICLFYTEKTLEGKSISGEKWGFPHELTVSRVLSSRGAGVLPLSHDRSSYR